MNYIEVKQIKTCYNYQEHYQSGILCLEAYTDQDWELYGSNIALEQYRNLKRQEEP